MKNGASGAITIPAGPAGGYGAQGCLLGLGERGVSAMGGQRALAFGLPDDGRIDGRRVVRRAISSARWVATDPHHLAPAGGVGDIGGELGVTAADHADGRYCKTRFAAPNRASHERHRKERNARRRRRADYRDDTARANDAAHAKVFVAIARGRLTKAPCVFLQRGLEHIRRGGATVVSDANTKLGSRRGVKITRVLFQIQPQFSLFRAGSENQEATRRHDVRCGAVSTGRRRVR